MERRKFITGLGALVTGSAAAMGTGAFTSVSADRGLAVQVSDDADAFLAISPEDTPNGSEFVETSGGTVSLDFTNTNESDYSGGGTGLNKDADTIIRDLLEVRNQGTQDVIVGVTGLPESMSVYTDDGDVAANGNSTSLNQDNYSPSSGNLARVEAGETMDNVGAIFRDPPDDLDFDGTVTINAIAVSELNNPSDVRSKYE